MFLISVNCENWTTYLLEREKRKRGKKFRLSNCCKSRKDSVGLESKIYWLDIT